MKVEVGQWAKYKGIWAYVCAVRTDAIWLSDWRGVKTIEVPREAITEVKDQQ